MIGTLAAAPPPSLGHLLLGFDATAPPQDWSRVALDPRGEYSCMTVLLKVLQVMHALQQDYMHGTRDNLDSQGMLSADVQLQYVWESDI